MDVLRAVLEGVPVGEGELLTGVLLRVGLGETEGLGVGKGLLVLVGLGLMVDVTVAGGVTVGVLVLSRVMKVTLSR